MDTVEIKVGGRTIGLETGRIARQASSAVLVSEGDARVLCAITANPQPLANASFVPLSVEYREQMSAGGRIPGGIFRRETRARESEILISRLCDRSLRPLFPKHWNHETQIIITVLSTDLEADLAILAILGASAALHLSAIPWQGPVAGMRVAHIDGKWQALPTQKELKQSKADITLSARNEGIVMIEGGAQQLPEGEVLVGLRFASEQAKALLGGIEALRKKAGREKRVLPPLPKPAFAVKLEEVATPLLLEALNTYEKRARKNKLEQAMQASLAQMETGVTQSEGSNEADAVLHALAGKLMRKQVLSQKKRADGRSPTDVRPIACEIDWLPSTHGSALFTRGDTQAMVSLTLGAEQDRALIESLDGVTYQRFMLHYNFPPYSVGEVRPLRGVGRREVGHGALARRALAPVLPSEANFPYTVRLLSEISESNGSSSMATVCGATLALLDGGVPLSNAVAGIAMGLISEGDALVILSDIQGEEDHLGDMDFKLAGSDRGITAIQMDNKLGSLTDETLAKALSQAKAGLQHILTEMGKVISDPPRQVKAHAPAFLILKIPSRRVRDLIGPGGKVIQEIQRKNGCRIEVNDDGRVRVFASNRSALEGAEQAILDITGELNIGDVLGGVVTSVRDFGVFVRIRGQEGLVHVSEWQEGFVEKLDKLVKVGDKMKVKVLEPDRQGRLRLSRRAAVDTKSENP